MPHSHISEQKSKQPQNPRKTLHNTRSNEQSARYACIVGHFATAETETIVEEGHSGANQGEIKL